MAAPWTCPARAGTDPLRRRDRQAGPGAGLKLEATGAKAAFTVGTDEPAVQAELVRVLRPGGVVYDVGANVGFLTLIAARLVGPEGRVYAFEPIPDNARAIERNAALNGFANVTVLELALTDRSGEAVLRIPRINQGAHLAVVGDAAGEEDDLIVRTAPLDELDGLRPPELVKLDVEGAESSSSGGCGAASPRTAPRSSASSTGHAPRSRSSSRARLRGHARRPRHGARRLERARVRPSRGPGRHTPQRGARSGRGRDSVAATTTAAAAGGEQRRDSEQHEREQDEPMVPHQPSPTRERAARIPTGVRS